MANPEAAALLPPGALASLARLTARWRQEDRRVLLYAAGSHTAALLRHSDLTRCQLLGIVDGRPELHGAHFEGLPVLPPWAMAQLRPEVILVSSFVHQDEIAASLAPLRRLGIEIATLYPARRFLHLQDHALQAGFRCHILPEQGGRPGRILVERSALRHPGAQPRRSRPGRFRRVKTVAVQGRPWLPGLYRRLLLLRRVLLRLEDATLLGELLARFSGLFRDYLGNPCSGGEVLDFTRPRALRTRQGGQLWHFSGLPSSLARVGTGLQALALRAGETVLQVGAYTGLHSLALAEAVTSRGQVWALEPDPQNFQRLRRNLRARGAEQVFAVAAGISTRSGRELFHTGAGPHSRLLSSGAPWTGLVSRPMWTLEQACAGLGLGQVDALSLSLEGAEAAVLTQAKPWLARVRPRLLINTHLGAQGGPDLDGLLEPLAALGYRVLECYVPGSPTPLLLARP